MARPRKQVKLYDLHEVMSVAVAVYDHQGFIKSGDGYVNFSTDMWVSDNKTLVYKLLEEDIAELPPITITEGHRQSATGIIDYFNSKLVMQKLEGTLSKFDEKILQVMSVIDGITVSQISLVASMPNSYNVSIKRDEMEEFYNSKRHTSLYVGTVGKRSQHILHIVDVKFIASQNIHMVTALESENNLVKFWWNKDPDISDLLIGKTLEVTAFVKLHSISRFSNCPETVINRVVIKDITEK